MIDTTQLQTNQKANADKLMSDRVVLVTGASRGIGAATAKLLGRQGAAVGVNYYTNEAAVIVLSSGASRMPSEGLSAHSTAKSGLDAFVKSLAVELGPHGIRANVVSPGSILTDATQWMQQEQKDAAAQQVPLRRNGLPEDVAGAVLLLASEQANFITGAYLPVSGGVQML
jgi:NAD(P)-dependent dehydrogenase (short-subunit alcohol dehydrogenase family)